MNLIRETPTVEFDLKAIRQRQKATWEAGDFGEVAKYLVPAAQEFMERLNLPRGSRVLDAACGTGNLALLAAGSGCDVTGVDIASNLIDQARLRARAVNLDITFEEGDVEEFPYPDGAFDAVVSMFGVMFAPRPDVAAAELLRVTKPQGRIAMANWTPEGFIGKMFQVFKKHLAPPPRGVPSPLLWGDEATVRSRLADFSQVTLARHFVVFRFPFPPAETVEFFRRFYGPTNRSFASLDTAAQAALRRDLVELQTAWNTAPSRGTTENRAEYLEVIAVR